MKLHANARTCPNSRRLLVRRIEEEGWSLTAAAEAAGVSERTARQVAGAAGAPRARPGLRDRSSAPRRRPTRLPADRVRAIEALRRLRMTAAEIAECLAWRSRRSRGGCADRAGKRSRLEPPEPPNRYERSASRRADPRRRQEARADQHQGRRSSGDRPSQEPVQGRPQAPRRDRLGVRPRLRRRRHPPRLRRGAGRRAAARPPPASCGGRWRWFRSMGITVERVMSDNGACYRSRRPRRAPAASSASGTSSPSPTGPAPTARPSASSRRSHDRWAYGAIYGSSAERTAALPGWLTTTTSADDMAPSATRPPAARLAELEQRHE